MSRRARAKGPRFIKIDERLHSSLAFLTLHGGALKLWIDLRAQFNGYNNGDLTAAMSVLRKRGWTSTDKRQRALNALLERRLIVRTVKGKSGPGKIGSLYGFTDLPIARNDAKFIDGRQPTDDYLQWMPGKKSVIPNQDQCCTRTRTSTVPEAGINSPSTIPETGSQKNRGFTRILRPIKRMLHLQRNRRVHTRNRTPL